MITHVIVRCEVCHATATIAAQAGAAVSAGWKFENGKPFGMHLCPKHRGLSWDAAKEKAWEEGITPALGAAPMPNSTPTTSLATRHLPSPAASHTLQTPLHPIACAPGRARLAARCRG